MPAIDWSKSHQWSFEPIDEERFPSIELARRCGAIGGSLTAIYNAANEVAVHAFIENQITFPEIVDTIEATITKMGSSAPTVLRDLDDVTAIEDDARRIARESIRKA